jgi:hypothetical protein
MPFKEKSSDLSKIRKARRALQKAIEIAPDHAYRKKWDSRLKILAVQEKLTSDPTSHELCLKLKDVLAEDRVYYTNACK